MTKLTYEVANYSIKTSNLFFCQATSPQLMNNPLNLILLLDSDKPNLKESVILPALDNALKKPMSKITN